MSEPSINFEAWRDELLLCGRIVADDDAVEDAEDAERRFERYVEMLEALHGDEGDHVAQALFASIQVEDDYGGYEVTDAIASRFGPETYCRALLRELPRLIADLPGKAGWLLNRIVMDGEADAYVSAFNGLLQQMRQADRTRVKDFIVDQERGDWLSSAVGVLGR